jgi:hypothetical protein
MVGVVPVLDQARTVGLEVRVEADRLVVRGPRRHEAIARQLLAHKPAVLALLAEEEAEVAWRVAAMRPRMPSQGPIPFLVARDVRPEQGGCLSCGDSLPPGRTYRCRPCADAAWRVVYAIREGITV